MENKNLEVAVNTMLKHMNSDDMREKTKKELSSDLGFSESESEKYAEMAFEWWSDAYE